MSAYYNEIDSNAAAWLRELIKGGHIADGEVDTRSIVDVRPADLAGFDQCHFFAGIGGWSLALRLAGWPDDRPVWTGSCPCQPFSAAGKRKGTADERHLWPAFYELIRACKPPIIFGEQVASAEVVGKIAKSRGRQKVRPSLSDAASSQGSGAARSTQGGEESDSVRSLGFSVIDPSQDRRGDLRSNGTAVQSGWRQDMGQPFTRSHRPTERLRLLELARGLSRREQRDGRLGRAEACGDGPSYLEAAEGEIERLLAAFGGTAEAESPDAWLDHVFADLERADYTCGTAVLPACSLGAPHIRQRLWFVGERLDDTDGARSAPRLPEPLERQGGLANEPDDRGDRLPRPGAGQSEPHGLADAEHDDGRADIEGRRPDWRAADGGSGGALRMADTTGGGRGEQRDAAQPGRGGHADGSEQSCRPGPVNGHWRAADWLYCRDGKWRPVEPGTFPLAHGLPARVGRLRGYGNAIVPQVAAEFIGAVME